MPPTSQLQSVHIQRFGKVCKIAQWRIRCLVYDYTHRQTGSPMSIQYNVFEILPDGSAILRAFVQGAKNALWMMEVLGKQTCNECFATTLNSRRIIGRINAGLRTAQINANDRRADAS
jgi:hypothetical protein